MKRNVRVFLLDIEECLERIDRFVKNMDKESFFIDEKAQDAVVHRIEILGEATKNIPEDFKKKYPDVPWGEMARTRDKFIHGYFGINLELVWKVVKDDLPSLKQKIQKILKELE